MEGEDGHERVRAATDALAAGVGDVVGLGLSPLMLLSIGTLIVVAYLILSINVYLESQALGRFSIGYGRPLVRVTLRETEYLWSERPSRVLARIASAAATTFTEPPGSRNAPGTSSVPRARSALRSTRATMAA
mgnify:CR=1 FL=1